jgi:hypothetical protein
MASFLLPSLRFPKSTNPAFYIELVLSTTHRQDPDDLKALTDALADVKLAPNGQAIDIAIEHHVLPNHPKARPPADYIPPRIALACKMLTAHLS